MCYFYGAFEEIDLLSYIATVFLYQTNTQPSPSALIEVLKCSSLIIIDAEFTSVVKTLTKVNGIKVWATGRVLGVYLLL